MKNPPPTATRPPDSFSGRSWTQETQEETERTRVKLVERDPKLAQAREELRFNFPLDRIVNALVRRRLDVPILAADAHHLRDLPRHVVRDAEAPELALLVQLVDRLERHLERRRAVGAVQVEDVN